VVPHRTDPIVQGRVQAGAPAGWGDEVARVVGRRTAHADDGFSLLETVLAAVLVAWTVALTATASISALGGLARLHHSQAAARLATQVIEAARSFSTLPDGSGCTPLLAGRTVTAVTGMLSTFGSALDLAVFDPAYAEPACGTRTGLPVTGLLHEGAVRANPVGIDGQGYSVANVVGTCRLLTTGGCVDADLVGTSALGQTLYRLVVVVRWSERQCPAGVCTWTTSTLLDASTDVSFSPRSPVPSAPTNVVAAAGVTSTTVTWLAPVRVGDAAVNGYVATARRVDGTVASTCATPALTLTCTIGGLLNGETYLVSVVASNSYGDGAESNPVSVVPIPAVLLDTTRLRLWLDGADAATLQTDCLTRAAATTSLGCWRDKSPQKNDASQTTAAKQPALTKVAGRLVPTFDGVNDNLDPLAARLPTGTSSSSAFVVAQLADPTLTQGSHRSVLNYGTVAGGAEREIQKEAGTSKVRVTVGGAGILLNGPWSLTRPTVVGATWTASAITSGVDGAAPLQLGVSYPGTGTAYAHVGAFGMGPTQYWYGTVPEVVVLSGVATAQEQQDLAEYLGRKWQTQTVPNPPTGLTVTSGGGVVQVAWAAPVWTGGTPVTQYSVTLSTGQSCTTAATTCAVAASGVSGATVSVTATNVVGTSRTATGVVP
jgi:type II secretory pathway pseudopilin PulG